jgi:hypothetical protein
MVKEFKAGLKMIATYDNTFAIQILPNDIKGPGAEKQIACLQ